jgi:hypothetical protein
LYIALSWSSSSAWSSTNAFCWRSPRSICASICGPVSSSHHFRSAAAFRAAFSPDAHGQRLGLDRDRRVRLRLHQPGPCGRKVVARPFQLDVQVRRIDLEEHVALLHRPRPCAAAETTVNPPLYASGRMRTSTGFAGRNVPVASTFSESLPFATVCGCGAVRPSSAPRQPGPATPGQPVLAAAAQARPAPATTRPGRTRQEQGRRGRATARWPFPISFSLSVGGHDTDLMI